LIFAEERARPLLSSPMSEKSKRNWLPLSTSLILSPLCFGVVAARCSKAAGTKKSLRSASSAPVAIFRSPLSMTTIGTLPFWPRQRFARCRYFQDYFSNGFAYDAVRPAIGACVSRSAKSSPTTCKLPPYTPMRAPLALPISSTHNAQHAARHHAQFCRSKCFHKAAAPAYQLNAGLQMVGGEASRVWTRMANRFYRIDPFLHVGNAPAFA